MSAVSSMDFRQAGGSSFDKLAFHSRGVKKELRTSGEHKFYYLAGKRI
jgi:hypothetical protein